MAKFLTGSELNVALEKIFEDAKEEILLVSPFISLHERLKSSLLTKINNPKLKITVVFGKNEENISKSMKEEDLAFFKDFPNIEIRYERRLHAKFYANEKSTLLTSMNLLNYSQDNNIEVGVLAKTTMILSDLATEISKKVTGRNLFDYEAYFYFLRVIDQAELLFRKEPNFENKLLGISKKYIDSTITKDNFRGFISKKNEYGSYKSHPSYSSDKYSSDDGFCIRTGTSIPFDIERPFSLNAYRAWNEWGNYDFPEKYCHYSGEVSNGETSMEYPILRKNWKKAQNEYNL